MPKTKTHRNWCCSGCFVVVGAAAVVFAFTSIVADVLHVWANNWWGFLHVCYTDKIHSGWSSPVPPVTCVCVCVCGCGCVCVCVCVTTEAASGRPVIVSQG